MVKSLSTNTGLRYRVHSMCMCDVKKMWSKVAIAAELSVHKFIRCGVGVAYSYTSVVKLACVWDTNYKPYHYAPAFCSNPVPVHNFIAH